MQTVAFGTLKPRHTREVSTNVCKSISSYQRRKGNCLANFIAVIGSVTHIDFTIDDADFA